MKSGIEQVQYRLQTLKHLKNVENILNEKYVKNKEVTRLDVQEALGLYTSVDFGIEDPNIPIIYLDEWIND